MLFDHYLCVSHWSLEFASPNANIQRTMVWIPFPGLNLLYYNENILMGLASIIGKPVRVDQNTVRIEKGRFARVCVEIDLTKPVIGKIWLRDHWYRVEYEGLHLICAKCGCYGHMTRDCASNSIGNVPSTAQPDKNNNDSPHHAPPHVDKNDSNSLPPPTGSTMVLTPHVSQVALGVIYNLEKETHGEWIQLLVGRSLSNPLFQILLRVLKTQFNKQIMQCLEAWQRRRPRVSL